MIYVGELPADLVFIKVVLAAVLGPVLGAVDGNCLFAHQVPPAHERNKLPKDFMDLFGMSFTKVSNRVIAGNQTVTEPHHFQVAPALLFQLTGGANAI